MMSVIGWAKQIFSLGPKHAGKIQNKHLEAEEIFRSTFRNFYSPKYSFFVGERFLNMEFASCIKSTVTQYGILFLAQDVT